MRRDLVAYLVVLLCSTLITIQAELATFYAELGALHAELGLIFCLVGAIFGNPGMRALYGNKQIYNTGFYEACKLMMETPENHLQFYKIYRMQPQTFYHLRDEL